MTDRKTAGFGPLDEASISRTRRDAAGDGGLTPIGYTDDAGAPRAWPGDGQFPHVKDPPEIVGPLEYRELNNKNPLPVVPANNLETGDPIDTRGFRLLELILAYTPGEILMQPPAIGAGTLLIIAEKQLFPAASSSQAPGWFPMGVVNPVLNTPGILPGFAWRAIFASELRLDPFVGLMPPFPVAAVVPMTLTFDVGTAVAVRFLFGELVAGMTKPSNLFVRYLLQR